MKKVDLLTVTYGSGELAKKYDNYLAPSAKVLIGKAKTDLVTACGVLVESVQVSLNLKDAASASISITDVYDRESRCIKSEVKSKLCLGESVIVELGYGSDRQDIFHGFIYECSLDLGDVPTMRITALEVRRLMYENNRKGESLTGTNEVQIFKQIMDKYANMNLSIETDPPVLDIEKAMTQDGNDLMMIKKLCEISDKCFLVCGGKVYFTKKKEPSAVAPLTWGVDILSFSQRNSYMNIDIEVRGNIVGNPEKYVETSTVTSGGNTKPVLQENIRRIITLPDVNSTDELAARAGHEEEGLKERMSGGSGSCIGIPVLVPGRYVSITGIDSDVDGDYYMQSVNHIFGSSGYTTDFTLGGKRA